MNKQKKKEEPKKKVTVTIQQLDMLFMKSKEYINLDKQKKNNEATKEEDQLKNMIKAPQRNRKDEETKIIKIVNLINTIEAYDKAMIQINNIDQFKSQIVASLGDPNKVLQFIPYIANVCYYIEKTNDLRGAVDLKQLLNDYYGCDIAKEYEKNVDQDAKTLFGILNIQSPSVQKYAQDFSKKYQVLDVPGLNYQPQQQQQQQAWNPTQYPQPQQGGGYPQQGGGYPQQGGGYPQQGGFTQQQQPQLYPKQDNYQQSYQTSQQTSYQQQIPQQNNFYPNSQQNNYGLQQSSNPYGQLQQFSQQNIYQNNPNVYQPQISQPQICLNPKQDSKFNYPQQQQSIYNTPAQKQNNGFVPLQQQSQQSFQQQQQQQQSQQSLQQQQQSQQQSQQQQIVDPFAILNQSNNQKMVELPPLPKQQNIQSNVPLNQNKNGDGFKSNLQAPTDEQVPYKSYNSQDQNNTGNFGQNNPLENSLNSRGTCLSDPLSDQNQNIFQTTTIGQDMAFSLAITNNKKDEEIPLQINHDIRFLEILHQYKNGTSQSINDSLNQLQRAGLCI